MGLHTWWCHQMETFSAWLAICAGNSPVTGEFPAQRPVTRNFDVFFDLLLNKRLSKQWWGWWFEMPSCPLWHHCNAVLNLFVLQSCSTVLWPSSWLPSHWLPYSLLSTTSSKSDWMPTSLSPSNVDLWLSGDKILVSIIHLGLVTPNYIIDLCQHWFRYWLVVDKTSPELMLTCSLLDSWEKIWQKQQQKRPSKQMDYPQ